MTCWRCSAVVAAADPDCRTCGAPVAAAPAELRPAGAAAGGGTMTAPDVTPAAPPAPPGWGAAPAAPPAWGAAPPAAPGWGQTPGGGQTPPGWGQTPPGWGQAPPGWGQAPGWSAPPVPRPPKRLAQWLVGLLALGVLADLVALVTGLVYRSVIVDLMDPAGTATEQQVADVETAYGLLGGVQGLCLLASGVVFLVWFSRVDGALRALGPAGLRHSHGWAVGSWFVPFLNLVRPKQMVDDAWRASDPQLPPGAGGQQGSGPPGWVALWWAFWILTSFLYAAGLSTGETLEDLKLSVEVTLVADALSAAAGALALLLVHRLSQRVRRQAELRGQLHHG